MGSLALAIIFLFFPWAFMMRWTSRLLVWGLFGPWMKLVDIYWYKTIENLSDEERSKRIEEVRKLRKKQTAKAAADARIARENAKKLKAMKCYMFGNFITKVPVLKFDRYRDIPLPSSSATPHHPGPQKLADLAMDEAGRNKTRVTGQQLVGDMIPALESVLTTEAPMGQPTAQPALLERSSPGAEVAKDSDITAMTTIGAIIVASGVLTFFGVPILVSSTQWVTSTVTLWVTSHFS